MSRNEARFNVFLVESIGEGLTIVLGEEGAKSVTFYIDPHIAIADPEMYAVSVAQLLETGTELLFSTIIDSLHRYTGVPKSQGKGFGEDVADARRKFQQQSSAQVR